MYSLFLNIILFGSLAVLIYLIARAAPRVTEEPDKTLKPTGFFDRLFRKLPLEKIDERLNIFFTKTLRKVKIGVMKLDNLLTRYLGKLKRRGESGDNRAVLFDKTGDGDKKSEDGG